MNPWGTLAQQSRREIQDLQNRKLHHFFNHYLYPFSPHYQKLFKENKIDPRQIKTAADLKSIPLSSKIDFFNAGDPSRVREFILQPDAEKIKNSWPKTKLLSLALQSAIKGKEFVQEKLAEEFRPVFLTFTTGTTNKPVSYVYSSYDIQNLNLYGARMLNLFEVKNSESIVNMFPFAPHLAFWQVVFGGLAAKTLILSTGGGKTVGTDGNIKILQRMQPSLIVGVPSYVYHVLRTAKEQGVKLSSIKKVVLGASKVTTAFKVRLAELLSEMGAYDARVFGTYGFTEARSAWAECPANNDDASGYHLYPDKEIFEVIDPKTGEVKGEGEDGELVYTSIDSRGSSVIRYRTGDFVEGGITWEPCPHCRRTVPRISSQITRLSDVKDLQLSKVKGTLVDLNHFSTVFSEFDQVEEWQIELRKKNDDPFEMDEMVVYISPRNGANPSMLSETISKRLLSTTEVAPNEVKFIPMPEMIKRLELETANKEKRIVDRRVHH
ncbi:MAG: AMP-binding protein [Candidatus Omnitrophica bacterium]|nr:AMP-binding protein [Candidatus Omnitrophota bacterium]